MPVAAPFAAVVGTHQIFRLIYFGDVLPNTAYVKLDGADRGERVSAGLSYLWANQPYFAWAAGAAVLALALARGARPLGMLWTALPVLLSAVLAGGDHMPGARLLVPASVLLAFTAALACRNGVRSPACVSPVIVIAAAVQSFLVLAAPVGPDPAARVGATVGRFLDRALPPGTLVSTATAGSTPYYAAELRFVDALGLNDRWIAKRTVQGRQTRWQSVPGHAKGDGAYVLDRRPAVVILGPAEGYLGDDPRAWFLTDFELLQSDRFYARYQPYEFYVPVERGELRVTLYVDRELPAAAALRRVGIPLAPPRQWAKASRTPHSP